MKPISIYFNNRKILLFERTEKFKHTVDSHTGDESVKNKQTDEMGRNLNAFFQNKDIDEISFEQENLENLLNEFKSHFKFIEAAGGLVRNAKNELLVIHRLGYPDLPKGKIESGESNEEAAIREVTEECGITDLTVINEDEPSYHIYFMKDIKILKKTYWFKMNYEGNEELIPQQTEAITKAEWCDNEKLLKYKTKTYSSLRRYF